MQSTEGIRLGKMSPDRDSLSIRDPDTSCRPTGSTPFHSAQDDARSNFDKKRDPDTLCRPAGSTSFHSAQDDSLQRLAIVNIEPPFQRSGGSADARHACSCKWGVVRY